MTTLKPIRCWMPKGTNPHEMLRALPGVSRVFHSLHVEYLIVIFQQITPSGVTTNLAPGCQIFGAPLHF